MSTEPKMFISPSYEFYNQCHGEKGRFCEGEDGPGRVRENLVKGKFVDDDYHGNAYNDGITDLNTVYHVTPSDNTGKIQKEGFKNGSGNWGVGTYFSPNKSESYSIYQADAHLHNTDTTVLKARTDIQNPLIVEAEDTANFWGKLSSSRGMNPSTVSSFNDYFNHYRESENAKYAEWGEDPPSLYISDYAKSNLKTVLEMNGNDSLLVRNPNGGGKGIGGVTLVVPAGSSRIWLAN